MARTAWTPDGFRWELPEDWDGADELARRLRTGRLLAQLLGRRGITDAEAARAFLNPKLTDLHDPEQLGGAAEAAEVIVAAVRAGRKIVLYGDYDVDGMAGVAILYRGLKMLGAEVDYYIPHRIDEGYGLNASALEAIAADGAAVVVTVDCGITAVDCARRAEQLGLTLVITDHHAPGPARPAAAAVVHPTAEPAYPNPDLCGAGVALKLAWQICRSADGARRVNDTLKGFLLDATCLAALGTIADVVPLTGENRALATHGLRSLPGTTHPGLRALIAAAGLSEKRVGAYDVGFLLAPRLNAAGRMGHARDAAELLIRPETLDCAATARALTDLNTQRQNVQRKIADEAIEMVRQRGLDAPDRRVIVVAGKGWHAGVIGIVASRLVDLFHRPAVVISLDDETGHGSARGIEGFHLAEALAACDEHLLGHGGHAMAAGLTVAPEKLDAFTDAMLAYAARRIDEQMLRPVLRIDAATTLGELSLPVAQQIESMAPFGAGNPAPVVAVRDATLHAAPRRMGARGATLGLLLAQGRTRLRCVGFGMGELVDRLVGVRQVDVAGEPTINRFAGRANVELLLKDVKWH